MAMVVYDENNNSAVLGDTQDQFFYGLDGNDFLQINFATSRQTIIEGGNGNDFLMSSQGNDLLYGGSGNDRLDLLGGDDYGEGGQGNDILVGDWEDSQFPLNGSDRLYGGDGDDTLWGAGKGDFLYGGDGNDILYGDRNPFKIESTAPGADKLYGGEGNDTMYGQAGRDAVDGGGGKDLLTGGLGADVLIGGLAADRFVFTSLKDSTPAGKDLIYDFRHGQGDKIDVSGIDARTGNTGTNVGNNKFKFIGDDPFSGAKGEFRYINGFVTADVNGDKVADLSIRIDGAPPSLVIDDFIL